MAALAYKIEPEVRGAIHLPSRALELYHGAEGFSDHFLELARGRVSNSTTTSLADIVLTIKNQTEFWIQDEPIS